MVHGFDRYASYSFLGKKRGWLERKKGKGKRKRNVGGHARVIKTLRDPRRGDQSYYKSGKSEERCNPEDLVASETLTVSVGRG